MSYCTEQIIKSQNTLNCFVEHCGGRGVDIVCVGNVSIYRSHIPKANLWKQAAQTTTGKLVTLRRLSTYKLELDGLKRGIETSTIICEFLATFLT